MARMIYNLNKGLVTGWRALSPAQLGGLPRPDKSQPDGICRLDRTPDLLTSSHALVHRGHNPSKLVHPLRLELSVRCDWRIGVSQQEIRRCWGAPVSDLGVMQELVGLDRWKEMRLRQSRNRFQHPVRESISRIGIKIIDKKSKQENRKKKEQLEWGGYGGKTYDT